MENLQKNVVAKIEHTEAKKPYTCPSLTVHGSVEDITQDLGRGGPFQPPIRTHS